MPASLEARSPVALLDEVERAREVLILTYTAALDFFERFALSDARALGALVTVVSDAKMVNADPVVVRRSGNHYLDARALCPHGAFHPKLVVVVGDGEARVAIGSGNLTMAGWHGNAELWTVLRADQSGGPITLRQVSAFLRELPASEVALSTGAATALARVADRLDELPADGPGPRLLHSLYTPIAAQLPDEGPVDELVLYAPFHDAALAGTRDLLDRLQPTSWTAFVQPDTEVDGPALERLAASRGGRLAWVSRHAQKPDGGAVPDERYWHGKLVQWRRGNARWALTGSPNMSRPALLTTVAEGNCELSLLAEEPADLVPAEGDPPAGGVASLRRSPADEDQHTSFVLLSAVIHEGAVALELHRPLEPSGLLQRYDVVDDRWRAVGPLPAGSDGYSVEFPSAPVSQALRILRDDHVVSNSVFVSGPERLRRRQEKTIGKVRATPEDLARLGLGDQLLADLDQLREHLLRVGATVTIGREPGSRDASGAPDVEGEEAPAVRPAPGMSLEDYLAACDPVLGQRMTEFALLLPALAGVGAALDDATGTLDSDRDDDAADPDGTEERPNLAGELRRQGPSERQRFRRFLERLVDRSAGYPMVIRNLAVRSVLHGVVAALWNDDRWPEILAEALKALGAPGDEPNEHERDAAASLAAVGLAVLRTDVLTLSRRDERTLRYESAGVATGLLLPHAEADKIELLNGEVLAANPPRQLADAATAVAAERAVHDVLRRPEGPERAARMLTEEHGLRARVAEDRVIELLDPLPDVAEPLLLRALALAENAHATHVRGRTVAGLGVVAAWSSPWLAIERRGPAGGWGRAWKLPSGQTPAILNWTALPKASRYWAVGKPRPNEVAELLARCERQGAVISELELDHLDAR